MAAQPASRSALASREGAHVLGVSAHTAWPLARARVNGTSASGPKARHASSSSSEPWLDTKSNASRCESRGPRTPPPPPARARMLEAWLRPRWASQPAREPLSPPADVPCPPPDERPPPRLPLELLESEAGLIRETAHQDDRGGLRLGDDHLPGDGEHEPGSCRSRSASAGRSELPSDEPARATLPSPKQNVTAERHAVIRHCLREPREVVQRHFCRPWGISS